MIAVPEQTALLIQELRSVATERRTAVLRSFGEEQAIDALVQAATNLVQSSANEALEVTELAVEICSRHGSVEHYATSCRARARALAYKGRFDEALDVCRDGLDRAHAAGLTVEAGRLQLASMHALVELGRFGEAIRVGQAARRAFLDAKQPQLAARADINLGIAHHRSDDAKSALMCFNRAKDALRHDPLTLGILEGNRGEALLAMNEFAASEQAFRCALRASQQASAGLTAAIFEGNLADLAARQGRLQRALYHFERARRQLENDPAAGHLARLITEQAEAVATLGLPQQALEHYQVALPELDRCGLALEAARARRGLGLVYIRLGRLSDAQTLLASSAKAFEELGHATAGAGVDVARAELALVHGRPQEARRLILRAMSIVGERSLEAVTARHLLARLGIEQGQIATAEADLSAALSLARELDLPPVLADVLWTHALLRRRQGRLNEAVADLSGAIEQVERVRGSLQAERYRGAFLGDRAGIYEALVGTLLDRGGKTDAASALGVAEQAKSRVLLEQMRRATDDLDDAESLHNESDPDAGLVRRMRQVRAELSGLYSRLGDERASEIGQAPGWRAAVRQREHQLDELEARLRTTQGAAPFTGTTVTAPAVQRTLDERTALIEYFAIDGHMAAFVVRPNDVQAVRALATVSELASHQNALRFQINRALRPGTVVGSRGQRLLDDSRRELGRLYEMLVRPLEPALDGAERLIIVPHGPTHVLPFHALWDGQRYAIERWQMHYAPSASLHAHLQSPSGANLRVGGRALVVGVADDTAPQIESEARTIGEVLKCASSDLLIGSDALAERVAEAAARADVLHLACHGRFSAENPSGSGLKLKDRWLTVREICALNLQARLVTLSGCETGVNLVEAGDELTGLSRSFFAAGVASLLVSLWRVDDRTTTEFMAAFYGWFNALGSNGRGTTAGALREAHRQVMARHPHPAFWAPFILVGRE